MKKILIIIAILLVALLGGIELYVQSDAFALTIRPYVVEQLKNVLGADARIGWVKANFLPPYVEVRDLSISDARAKQIVSLRKVRVYFNPIPLLWKHIRISLISMREPRVYAERDKEGALNLTPLLDRIKANLARKQSEGPARYGLSLGGITVRNGQIEFKDAVTATQLSIPDLHVKTSAGFSQDRINMTIRSPRVRFSAPAYPALLADFKTSLEYSQGRVRVDFFELSSADAVLTVSGDAGPLPDSPLNLKLTIRSGSQVLGTFVDVLNPHKKKDNFRIAATALIQGKLSDPVVEGAIRVSALVVRDVILQDAALSFDYRDKKLSIKGKKWKLEKGEKKSAIDGIDALFGYRNGILDIQQFDARADDLSLRLDGRVDPATGFDILVNASSSDKGRAISFLTAIPVEGNLNLTGRLSGPLASPRFDGAISTGIVRVRGIPFHDVNGRVAYADKKITLSSINIHEQTSRYVFDGSVDFDGQSPVYDARLQVLRSDVVNVIALFYKQLPLKLSAAGELSFSGTAGNYSGSGYLKLDAGSAYGESFTRGTVTASLATGKIAFPQVVLYKEKGMVKATGWIGFDGTYSADLESRGIDLAKVDRISALPLGGESRFEIHTMGSFSRPKAKALLSVGALSYRRVLLGGLRAEAEVKDGRLVVNAGLSEERARLSFQLTLKKPYAWTVSTKVMADGIDPFLAIGNTGLADRVKLVVDGSMTAHGEGAGLNALYGKAVFNRLSLIAGEYRIDNESDAGFTINAGRLAVTSLNFTGPGTRVVLKGDAKLLSDVDMTLTGTADLSLLRLMFREVEHAAGTADMKLSIQDDWDSPDVAGELRMQGGEIKVKDIPQRFTALNGKIAFTQGKIVTDSLTGEMGGGTLSMSGWAQLAGFALKDFSARATADNVTVRYPEGLTSTLSGNLYYDGDTSEQALTGDFVIKRARYDKRIEWKSMLVDIGRGLYHKKKTDVGWIGDTQINVRFHGTDNIVFENNLANMPLDVDVFLQGTVNLPQLVGRIEARKGMVYFRKNEFKILHASADFVDPGRMNPVLDIQAETQVREYQIRLSVTGTAERAVVTFVSDPSLIDTDILSLLALGKTGAELKGKESGVGAGEAVSFASGQFQDVFERQSRSLTGLDRFSIDPYVSRNDTSVPRVTAGKELIKNKLYATYSSNVGASYPEQVFSIEYILDKHFSLVGARDDLGSNGADIKYRFEFK
jgi:translocation and assembly module TamB